MNKELIDKINKANTIYNNALLYINKGNLKAAKKLLDIFTGSIHSIIKDLEEEIEPKKEEILSLDKE